MIVSELHKVKVEEGRNWDGEGRRHTWHIDIGYKFLSIWYVHHHGLSSTWNARAWNGLFFLVSYTHAYRLNTKLKKNGDDAFHVHTQNVTLSHVFIQKFYYLFILRCVCCPPTHRHEITTCRRIYLSFPVFLLHFVNLRLHRHYHEPYTKCGFAICRRSRDDSSPQLTLPQCQIVDFSRY